MLASGIENEKHASDPTNNMEECSECGKSVKPANGYLGGGVLCNDCTDALVEENTIPKE